ncbi:chromosomal passenger protein, putative [Leishmania panamensis]|uniref:Chromosomal passenger protein, putative n=3 Tax=Leishmania guyanensis species complex TaxID=38579 RepID=A0A088RY16_LEIPA|nr:chromosomal passenger protein, putative [Leishmania panamensis]AIO01058.1 chromosomal passenger protein, putative [Leishmania panamensis]CCM18241.1 chromosomal passenger protein, putative [Leishmania guyanensis]
MSGYRSDIDPFKEIRVLPREVAQLRHHLSRINHALQTKYFVAAELSELALQPDKSDEFLALYTGEIHRVVARLNKNAKRQYTVRVDPLRLTSGFDFQRAADHKGNLVEGVTPGNVEGLTSPEVDGKWTASLVETGKQLAQQQAIEARRQALAVALQSTPSTQQTQSVKDGGGVEAAGSGATGGASTGAIDSDVRKANKESFLFSTPPEFTGFTPY